MLGPIGIEEKDGAIVSLRFEDFEESERGASTLLEEAERQILEYLDGKRRDFDLPLEPHGTEYQKRVWKAVMKIPYGETQTYRWISEMAGGSPRSAGNALGANPIPVLIPCHRVVRSDGSPGGYSSGIRVKKALLDMERLHSGESVLK